MKTPKSTAIPLAAAADDAATLLEQARNGTAAAFETIMRQNNRRLYRIARSILNDEWEAEDVVQETYLRAFTNLADIKNPMGLKSWLSKVAANEALGRLRRRKPVVAFEDRTEDSRTGRDNVVNLPYARNANVQSMDNPEMTIARREMLHLVEAALAEMPMIYRSVFILRAIEGLSVEEAADYLNISKEAVKTRYHRAKKSLYSELKQMAFGTLDNVFSFDGARCDRIVDTILATLARENITR